MIHLDTSFLVDLSREKRAPDPGPAHHSLEAHRNEVLEVSIHVACELLAGAACSRNPPEARRHVEALLRPLPVVPADDRFAYQYAELFGALRLRGEAVSAMELLIGTAAFLREASLITRNPKDFQRIPGLKVLSY